MEPRVERVDTGGDGDDQAIPDNNPVGTSKPVPIGALPGGAVTAVDVTVAINHNRVQDLDLYLVHPGGDEVRLRDNSGDGGSGARTWRYSTDAFDDRPAGGIWHVRVVDTVPGNGGALTDVRLAVHHAGGPDQLARSASFTSLVRDLGANVVSIDARRAGGHSPTADGIAVRLRGCDAPEQCEAEPWSAPLVDLLSPAGAVPGLAPRRYLQYRVELTSNGEREPEVDWIEVDYRVPPP
jgi:subtilisin-like proprotein convertase family protein